MKKQPPNEIALQFVIWSMNNMRLVFILSFYLHVDLDVGSLGAYFEFTTILVYFTHTQQYKHLSVRLKAVYVEFIFVVLLWKRSKMSSKFTALKKN